MNHLSDLISLPFSFIAFEGEQARTFLQGQVSCDVMEVTPTHSILGCYANPKGRVEAIFYLFEREHRLFWAIPYDTTVAELCVSNLKKFAAFSKVTVSLNHELKAFGLEEPTTEQLNDAQNAGYSILRCDKNVILMSPSPETKEALPNSQWLEQEFKAGIPHITGETLGLFLPHHLNLLELGALNFKKGCYRGQEIIARMHYKSTIKKHLQALSYSGTETLHPGQVFHNIEIVNRVKISDHETILLAIIDNHAPLPEGFQ